MLDAIREVLFFGPRPQLDDFIRHVAKQCVAPVQRRLSVKVSQMGEAELRGYVWARAQRPVRAEAQRMVAEHRLAFTVTDSMIDAAVERTVHLVLQLMKTQPVAATAAARATLKAAG